LNWIVNLFIDFENHQPPASDFLRAHGADCGIWVFHGPHQNKFAADVVTSWQPLGARVRFIQSSRPGKNALDFHIAHALGMTQQHDAAAERQGCYIVVSNDSGFDALFDHVRSLGAYAGRAGSIPEALALAATFEASAKVEISQTGASTAPMSPASHASAADAASATKKPSLLESIALKRSVQPGAVEPAAAKVVPAKVAPAKVAPAKVAPAKVAPAKVAPAKVAPAKVAPAKVAPAKVAPAKVAPAKVAPAKVAPEKVAPDKAAPAKAAPAKKPKPAPRDRMMATDVDTVIAGLRASPRNRPSDRKALQRHIVSLLHNEATLKVSDAVIEALERSKVIAFNANKVEYRLPKAKA
jgi:hypothetical protein